VLSCQEDACEYSNQITIFYRNCLTKLRLKPTSLTERG
jgi:hypothetical protein